jgi:predicted acylesterase/phospholipase RssA
MEAHHTLPQSQEHEVPVEGDPRPNILIALSGGGFRATLFHLGAMRAVRDAGLLDRVRAISSVSGGSITAAHLVHKWHEYKNLSVDHFRDLEKDIREFSAHGIRNQIVAQSSPTELLTTSRATALLTAQYERLWGSKELRQLYSDESAPRLFIMATNLSRHTAYSYFTHEGYMFRDSVAGNDKRLGKESLPIACAVAASSAFPALFPAYELSFDSVQDAGASRDFLTDGGVFENLGLTVLRDYCVRKSWELGRDATILLSNAGRAIDWDVDTDFSRGAASALSRVFDVIQYWSERRLQATSGPGIVHVSINNVISPPQGDRTYPSTSAQRAAASIRTDFDAFSKFEQDFLYDYGYYLTRRSIEADPNLSKAAKVQSAYTPWAVFAGDWEGAESKLRSSINWDVPWRLWIRKPLMALAITLLLLGIGIWLTLPWLGSAADRSMTWLVERQFKEVAKDDIEFATISVTAASAPMAPDELGALVPFRQPEHLSRESEMAVLAARRHYLETMPGKIIVVLQQEKPFLNDSRTTTRWLRYNGNVRVSFGSAFLIDPEYATRDGGLPYREIRLPRDSDDSMRRLKRNVVFQPRGKEFFVFVLVVTPLNEKADLSVQDVEKSKFVLGVEP